jgi:hypothetical protein
MLFRNLFRRKSTASKAVYPVLNPGDRVEFQKAVMVGILPRWIKDGRAIAPSDFEDVLIHRWSVGTLKECFSDSTKGDSNCVVVIGDEKENYPFYAPRHALCNAKPDQPLTPLRVIVPFLDRIW